VEALLFAASRSWVEAF